MTIVRSSIIPENPIIDPNCSEPSFIATLRVNPLKRGNLFIRERHGRWTVHTRVLISVELSHQLRRPAMTRPDRDEWTDGPAWLLGWFYMVEYWTKHTHL